MSYSDFTLPLVMMVEAKNDNIKSGIPQCGAEMFAAQVFNAREQHPHERVYGCVSTGTTWKFLQLHQRDFLIDCDEYYIDMPEKIMGILMTMCLPR